MPTIDSFSPASGRAGRPVTISGSGFTNAVAVAFEGLSSPFIVDSDSEISTTVPPTAASGKISVEVPGATRAESATSFRVVAGNRWSQFGYHASRRSFNAEETKLSASNVSGLTEAWQAGGDIDAIQDGSDTPVVADGAVYATTGDQSQLLAMDAVTGAPLWTFDAPSGHGELYCNPAVARRLVYVSSTDAGSAYLYAVHAGTGKLAWSFTDSGNAVGDPAVTGGIVYVVSVGGVAEGLDFPGLDLSILYALHGATGRRKWIFQPYTVLSSPQNLPSSTFSAPAVADNTVYLGAGLFAAGLPPIYSVYALSAETGTIKWTQSNVDGYSTPAVTNGAVYLASADTVYALKTSDGTVTWSAPLPTPICSNPAVASGIVFVASAGTVYALRSSDGTQAWSSTIETTSSVSTPAVANGIVYVTSQGAVYALDESSGSLLWSSGDTGYFNMSAVAVLNGMIYVVGDSGDSSVTAYGLGAISPAEQG